MEIRQLEHFVAAAEERHFTRAARRVHIVQSGLSGSIRALERELGATLFVRSTRRVELTEAGRALLVHASRVLAAVHSAEQAVKAVEALLQGRLTIGIMQHFASKVDVQPILGRFHTAHPGVQIRVVQGGSPILMEGVREGQLDLAVLGRVGRAPDGIITTLLARDSLLLALPASHRLASRKMIALSSLADEDFVDFQPTMALRMIADRAFTAAGVRRRTACEVNNVPTLLDLVAQGLGIALVPQVATSYPAKVRYVRPRPPIPTWDVAVAHAGKEPANPAARAFLKVLLESSRKRPQTTSLLGPLRRPASSPVSASPPSAAGA